MQNFRGLDCMRKCLKCEFPPCNCQKCKKLRSEGKTDQDCYTPKGDGSKQGSYTLKDDPTLKNGSTFDGGNFSLGRALSTLGNRKLPRLGNFSIPKLSFTPSVLSSVLFDIVGIIAFFIMATMMFWITTSIYWWHFIEIIYKSGRKARITTLVLVALLGMCITFHAVQGRQKQPLIKPLSPSKPINEISTSLQEKRQNEKSSENLSSSLHSCNSKQSNTLSLCDLCANEKKKKSTAEHILSDHEVREMYKLSKLYAIPIEMKSPPQFLVYFVEYLFNLFSG